ncbi:MAG: DUF5666 domain-containing protein [Acidobacteriota bacterium]
MRRGWDRLRGALRVSFCLLAVTAAEVAANIDHITGRITEVRAGGFQVDQNFNADPQSGYRRRYREIVLKPATVFEGSAPEDLRVGRTVDVIGLKVDQTRVQATRIIVYEGRRPVRMQPGRVVLPDGTVREPRQ